MWLLMRSQTTPQVLWRWDGPSELSPQKGKGTKPSHPHMDQSWDAGRPREGSVILGLGPQPGEGLLRPALPADGRTREAL